MSNMNSGKMILVDGNTVSLDDKVTKRNNNVAIIGASGTSKTRSFITPNLLECKGSYIVTDAKGNLYRKWHKHMEANGYRVIRVSFIHPEISAGYNPLHYIERSQDILSLSSAIVKNDKRTIGKVDPFWDDTSLMLSNAIIGIILENEELEDNERNMHMVLELLRKGRRSSDLRADSELDRLFEEVELIDEESWACKQYNNVAVAPAKTFNTIVATTIAKLGMLDTKELKSMMQRDEIDFKSIGCEKTAVFVEVSDTDRSMDFLINIFFTQAMNQLCRFADDECTNNELPVPVRFFMDDFATNCRIDNFENMISNIRSRKISVSIVLQSIAQLKSGYGENAHTIIDNCDTLIYMGGNDLETAREIAHRCDKSIQSVLHMPISTSWIFRRGEFPYFCKNMDLDDYLQKNNIRETEVIPHFI